MKPVIISLFNEDFSFEALASVFDFEVGEVTVHQFPDAETCVKINTDVQNRQVIIYCSLNEPNAKILPLLFMAETAKDLGATRVGLVSPYLPYMRQDKRFTAGEGITSSYFAALLSNHFDWLITVDPHLHRRKSLDEIYTIPSTVLHATLPITDWIAHNVQNPLVIGPDSESEQWIAAIANNIGAPYLVAQKIRRGDERVEVSLPSLQQYTMLTPILVDDIISTGKTLIEATQVLKRGGMKSPLCIGIHGIFAQNAYDELIMAGISRVITCNTIRHLSNEIDLTPMIGAAIKNHLA